MMTVSGIPGSNAAAEVGGAREARRPNVKALREALQAGDMGAAKAAFAKIYKNVKHAPTDAAHDGIASNIKRLIKAVDAGDIGAAQDSLKSINVDRSTVYSPGQLPGAVRQMGRDFNGLVHAIQSGDTHAASAALHDLRVELKPYFSTGAPFHIQPEPKAEPVRIQPIPQPVTTLPVSESVTILPVDAQA